MGRLARFDLISLVSAYGTRVFVETGTGTGDSLVHAASLPPPYAFDALYSCEINPTLAAAAVARFDRNPRVHVHAMQSRLFLSEVLLPRAADDTPYLFWLDAHFPGADYGLATYDDPTVPPAVRLPLAEELTIIRNLRPDRACRDVILIDDARIWLDPTPSTPFANGPLPANLRPLCPNTRNIQFVYDLFTSTHRIRVDYADEGYIVLTPTTPTASGNLSHG